MTMPATTAIAATLVGTAAALMTYREDAEHPISMAIFSGGLAGILTVGLANVFATTRGQFELGELVKITTPHGSGDTEGRIAQVHAGPAYEVTIDDAPHRWYVGEEMRRQ